jgi:hypothetical protein
MKFINDVGVRNDKVVYIRISNNDYSIVEDISIYTKRSKSQVLRMLISEGIKNNIIKEFVVVKQAVISK